jgi:beta-lactam-binding protein with PASTA domain
MLLKNNKLFVGDTTYVPDIARGAIKEQRYKGMPIRPGEMIPQGSKIALVIGNGLGNTEFEVPDVTRMTIDEALATINQYNLIPNIYVAQTSGDIIDTSSAYIISQSPSSVNDLGEHNKIKMGSVIDLSIKQHPDASDYENKTGNIKSETDVNSAKKNSDEDK